jgi:hypothetical protein
VAEFTSNYLEIRGAGFKYRKMGVVFFLLVFSDLSVVPESRSVGVHPTQIFAEKARQDHQLRRPREAAQMRAGLAFTITGAFAGLLRSFLATHAVVTTLPFPFQPPSLG